MGVVSSHRTFRNSLLILDREGDIDPLGDVRGDVVREARRALGDVLDGLPQQAEDRLHVEGEAEALVAVEVVGQESASQGRNAKEDRLKACCCYR